MKHDPDGRYTLAINVVGALMMSLRNAKLSIRRTTSDCPIVRVDLGDGEVFHLTITRARS